MKLVSRNVTLFTVGCTLPRPLKNLRVKYQLYYKYNVYRPYLIGFDVNFCNVMDSTVGSILINQFKVAVSNYTNVFRRCPLEGRIFLKDFPYSDNIITPGLPIGDYRADCRLYTKYNDTIFYVRNFFTLKPKGIKYYTNG